jgi:hypothetical protein
LVPNPLRFTTRFFFNWILVCHIPYVGLSFTIASSSRQRSHCQVRVLRDSWPHFTVSDSRILQPGGPGPRIYIPQEQGRLIIPAGTGFPFRRLLRIAWLRWRCSTPPRLASLLYNQSARTEYKTLFATVPLVL